MCSLASVPLKPWIIMIVWSAGLYPARRSNLELCTFTITPRLFFLYVGEEGKNKLDADHLST